MNKSPAIAHPAPKVKSVPKPKPKSGPRPKASTRPKPAITLRPVRVKLIFNPVSGTNGESPVQLMDVIRELQFWHFVPEVYMIEPECDMAAIVRNSMAQGIRMFVVCGGDGTIAVIAKALIGTDATLGIIPTGTQNNLALSFGIPSNIPAAVALLRNGRHTMIDVGTATCKDTSTPFIEMCSVGLFTTVYQSSDDIQHGNVSRIGDFLSVLTKTPPSKIRLFMDGKREIQESGHVVMISNMPYIGQHYLVGTPDSFTDGLLDVLFFADLSKLDLINYVLQGPGTSESEDPRIKHFRVRKLIIETKPAMPIMVDGMAIGSGAVVVAVQRQALGVMLNPAQAQGGLAKHDPVSEPARGKATPITLAKIKIKGIWGKIASLKASTPPLLRSAGSTSLLALLLVFMPLQFRAGFWTALESQIVLVTALLVLCLVAFSLAWAPGQRLDVRLLMYLNLHGKRSPILDWVMLIFTQIGSGIFAAIFGFALFFTPGAGIGWKFLLGSLSLVLLVSFMKFLFQRSRPYVVLNSTRIVGSQDSGRSFPSGHTSQAWFMATFMAINCQLHPLAIAGFFLAAFGVGITRIYVGMHYPRDVLGGVMLGVSWGLLGLIVTKFIFQIG